MDDKRGRSGLLWLIFGPFCRISAFDKGILIFRFDLTFTAPSNLTKFGQHGHTLDKVRYVRFGNQLRSKGFGQRIVDAVLFHGSMKSTGLRENSSKS